MEDICQRTCLKSRFDDSKNWQNLRSARNPRPNELLLVVISIRSYNLHADLRLSVHHGDQWISCVHYFNLCETHGDKLFTHSPQDFLHSLAICQSWRPTA